MTDREVFDTLVQARELEAQSDLHAYFGDFSTATRLMKVVNKTRSEFFGRQEPARLRELSDDFISLGAEAVTNDGP